MGKGHPSGSQSLVRITTAGRAMLVKLRARFQARTGKPVSFATALETGLSIADRTMDNRFMQGIADGLNEKTARSAASLVAKITGEAATVEKVDGHWLIGVAGKSYPVVVDPSALAEDPKAAAAVVNN